MALHTIALMAMSAALTQAPAPPSPQPEAAPPVAPAAAPQPAVTAPAQPPAEPKPATRTIRISRPGHVSTMRVDDAALPGAMPGASGAGSSIVVPENTMGPGEPQWLIREREEREQRRLDLEAAAAAGLYDDGTYTVNSLKTAEGWEGVGWTTLHTPGRGVYRNRVPRAADGGGWDGGGRRVNREPRPVRFDPFNTLHAEHQRQFNRATQPARVYTDPKTGLWVQDPTR